MDLNHHLFALCAGDKTDHKSTTHYGFLKYKTVLKLGHKM